MPDVKGILDDGDARPLRRAILGPLAKSSRPPAYPATADEHLDGSSLQLQTQLQAALSDSPLVQGNAVHVLRSGQEAFGAMFEAMQRARDHINMEFFILADVRYRGRSLSEVLLDRLQHGVRVNMIYDSFGSRATPRAFFDRLRQAGALVVEFNPLDPLAARAGWAPNDRDHRKLLVVDGQVGFMGGINLDPVYENPQSAGVPADGDTSRAYWRDTAMRIEGPAVAQLQDLFFGTWKAQKGPLIPFAHYFPPLRHRGEQTIRIIGSAPGDQRPLYFVSLMTAIGAARQSIWLSSGYFVPPHEEREALYKAARRGIDVRILAPSHSDVQATVYAARASYGDLLESGARVWEMQDAVLHSKLTVIDGVWSVIGSSNLDRRSVVFNNEVDAIILGHDTGAQVQAILRQDIAASREITLAAWDRRSLAEHVREWKARIWQYWM